MGHSNPHSPSSRNTSKPSGRSKFPLRSSQLMWHTFYRDLRGRVQFPTGGIVSTHGMLDTKPASQSSVPTGDATDSVQFRGRQYSLDGRRFICGPLHRLLQFCNRVSDRLRYAIGYSWRSSCISLNASPNQLNWRILILFG
jgi:hypothetical protein